MKDIQMKLRETLRVMMIEKSTIYRLVTIFVGVVCILNLPALAAEPIIVDVDNFVLNDN